MPSAGQPARRRARVRLQARPDPRRRLRDAAQGGALPQARRGRPSSFADRAGERSDGVVGLIAEHFARAAALGSEAGLEPPRRWPSSNPRRSSLWRPPATPPPRSTPTPRRSITTRPRWRSRNPLDPGTRRPDRREAGRRRPPDGPRRRGRRGLGAWPRVPPQPGGPRAGRGPAPQDRRRRSGTRASAAHRSTTTSEGINLLKDGAAVHRAGAPLRGGRLALHAHRRQHARDLRVREGAAAGRAAGRGAGREPRARHLRAGVRPHRRLREGAREPGALGRARPRLRPRRGGPRAAHPRLSPRGLRGRLRRRRRGLPRGAGARPGGRRPSLPGRAARLARAARRVRAPTGRRSSGPPRRAPAWPSARASTASSASPT